MRTNLSILAAATALFVLAPAGSVATASPSTAPAKSVRLQQALDAVVAAGAPGAIVLVRDGDRTIRLASGYGNLARRTPMRASDRFRIGSETKMFIATVVLQLVGDDKLSLADTVERRLPGLVPNGGRITVRQLLNHTSGLFDYAEDKAFIKQVDNPRKHWAPRQLVELATAQPPLFAPGSRHSYSNTGYILLGLIVEKTTGNSLRRSSGNGSSRPCASMPPASRQRRGSPGATHTATPATARLALRTSASSVPRSSGRRERSSRTPMTSPASTRRSSAAACSAPTSSPR